MSRFRFVADHRDTFEVKWLCAVVEVARSSFYAWLAAADARAARQAADEALAARIRTVHADDNTYGAPRITAELNDGAPADQRVNHKRVARVIRTAGIAGYRRRRRVKTTTPDQANNKVPDLLKRDFTAPAPNTRYVGDITYLPLATGANLYLATVIDCYSGRVAGWAIAEHMRTELVEDALKAADALRVSLTGAVFHSDHGSHYTSTAFGNLCKDLGVTQSMGGVGSASGSRHRSPVGVVGAWRRQVSVGQRLPWLSRRSELFTPNPACLRLRPARILPLARHRRRGPGVGDHRHCARLHAILPPDHDRGTPGQRGVDDGQAPRSLCVDDHQSPSCCPDGFVHLPHAI